MKYIQFLLILVLHLQTSGQTYESPEKVEQALFTGAGKNNNIQFTITDDQGNLYSFSQKHNETNKDLIIDVFDKEFNHVRQDVIDKDKKTRIRNGKFVNGKLQLFGINYNKSIAKFYTVDYNEAELVEESVVFDLSKDDKLTSLPLTIFDKSYDSDGQGYFVSSKNGKFHLFSHDVNSKKNQREKHSITVLDKDFNVAYTQLVDLPVKDKLMDVISFDISDEGIVYLTAKKFENDERKNTKRKNRKEDIINYHYEIIKVTKENVVTKEIPKTAEEKNVFSSPYLVFANDNPIFIGKYSDNSESDTSNGLFILMYNENLEIVKDYAYYPFNEEKPILSKKHLVIKDVHIDSKNTLYCFLEFQNERSSMSVKGKTSFNYIYGFLLAGKINMLTGKASFHGLDKSQTVPGLDYDVNNYYNKASSRSFLIDDKLHFFLNYDKIETTSKEKIEFYSLKKYKQSTLLHCYLDEDDEIKFKSINKSKEIMCPRHAVLLNDNSILINGNNGKKQKIMRITF